MLLATDNEAWIYPLLVFMLAMGIFYRSATTTSHKDENIGISKVDAYKYMEYGRKVRHISWDGNMYIRMVDKQIIDENENEFDFITYNKPEGWIILK
jgi:hypothetical protein